jgi:hypothetical protein
MFNFAGGLPSNESILNRTKSHFFKPFSGCLQGIQILSYNNNNSNVRVTSINQQSSSNVRPAQHTTLNSQDFSHYVGENIGECELFDEFVNSLSNL